MVGFDHTDVITRVSDLWWLLSQIFNKEFKDGGLHSNPKVEMVSIQMGKHHRPISRPKQTPLGALKKIDTLLALHLGPQGDLLPIQTCI
jgi:hypothetical protein